MLNNYINNFENIVSFIFFASFKLILITLTISLILSLIMLAVGCLIKSQKMKSKFLIVVPTLLVVIILFLLIPILLVHFKKLI